MHHESTHDAGCIFISDSSDEVQFVDLTVNDDVIAENREKPDPKFRECERVMIISDDESCTCVRRGNDGTRAGYPGSLNGTEKMGLPEFKEANKSTKMKKSNKQRKPVVTYTLSSDSDFELEHVEEKFSPKKQQLHKVRRILNHRRGTPKKPTMLSLSRPVGSFPVSLFNQDMKPKLTNLHLKHGCTSESEPTLSDSDSDLPNPCNLLLSHQQVQAASPILVQVYPPIAVKRCSIKVDHPNSPASPLKKRKMVQHDAITRESSTGRMTNPPPHRDRQMKKPSKPLLSLSDFSDSDDDFEPRTKHFPHTPSKQSWLKGISPPKTSEAALPRPFRKEDRLVGTPIHISFKDVKRGPVRRGSVAGNSKNKQWTHRVNSTDVLDFCQRQHDLIEAVVDEGFVDDSIALIRDFATLHRGAPKKYMMYLLKDVLLADNTEDSTVLSAYEALMHIHSLHPTATTNLTLDWDLVTTIIKKLNLETKSESIETPRLSYILALQFVVVFLMDDFKAARRKEKSCLYALLSVDMCLGNVRNLIQWICRTISEKLIQKPREPKTEQEPEQKSPTEDRNIWQFLKQLTKENSGTLACECEEASSQHPMSEGHLTVLHLLQKLLLLSFATSKKDSALQIAEEFLYPYLYIPSLQLRKICLQTMTCDPVRSKVIELLLENICELSSGEQQGMLSVQKIVSCHFKSRPMQVSKFVHAEDNVNANEKWSVWSPSNRMQEKRGEECEEVAMLLFYLLQSYVRNKTAHLQQTVGQAVQPSSTPDKLSLPSQPAHPTNETGLSMEDRECLLQMGDHAEALETRLRNHCNKLTMRTRLYLAMIDSMREQA